MHKHILKFNFVVLLVVVSVAETAAISSLALPAENLRLVLTESKLPRPVYSRTAVYDGDDSVYIIGGESSSNERLLHDEVIKYSISSGLVQVLGSFIRITDGTAFMDGDDIFYIGGLGNDFDVFSSGIYRISPPRVDGSTNFTYELINRLPVPCARIQVAWDSGNRMAYIFGGRSLSGGLDTIVQYNVTSNALLTTKGLEDGIYQVATAWDPQRETAYLFGGFSSAYSLSIKQYNPTTDSFQDKSPLPHIVPFPHALYADRSQEVYIVTNNIGLVKYNSATDTAEDVHVEGWLDPFTPGGTVYVPKLDRIYIFGGSGNFGGSPSEFRNEIWYIDLEPSASPSTTTQEPELPPPVDCSDGLTRLVPNPFCCENFYLCHEGVPNKYECTNGQQFHPIALQCQDASVVGCRNSYNDKIAGELEQANS